ncbi:oligopeptide transporter substrate-binding protein [Mycobacterium sp. 1164966.3]|uniref:oligopeptide transporter substrate-binding protein n=1 Tax=Mycobacterium sp. 1164966.3 TaxID=1856861 RepID=UPI0012E80170|nr:oligopeptide transporter substrate-binding protein [Mycobacterium sp. 1164966.3]
MARNDPSDYGANDPAAHGNLGYAGNSGAEFEPEPVPAWRKPVGLLGIGLLIAVLIGLIIFGVLELMHGPGSTPAPTTSRPTTATTTAHTTSSPTTTTTTPTTTATTTTPPPAITTIPTGVETDTPTTGSSQPHHLPHLPHF